jgi:hypothetical protein
MSALTSDRVVISVVWADDTSLPQRVSVPLAYIDADEVRGDDEATAEYLYQRFGQLVLTWEVCS